MFSTLLATALALQLKSQENPPPALPPAAILRQQPTKVMAMVNGQPITGAEVEKYLWDWKSDEVVSDLVGLEIIEMAAKKLNITVTPAELKTKLDIALAQSQRAGGSDANPWDAWAKQGYPPSRLKMTIRSVILLGKIAERDFKPNEFVDISAILIKPKGVAPEDKPAAMKIAQDAYDQLQKGVPWSKIYAADTSDPRPDPNNENDLGLRALSLFPPAAAVELKTLKPGQVTHPVDTPAGYQIFKLNRFGSAAKPQELEQLKQEFIQRHEQDVLKKLKDEAKVVTIH